jgi:hypothetical protein
MEKYAKGGVLDRLFGDRDYTMKGEIVEGDTARGTTTLVNLKLHISLYTGTVHVLSGVAGVHPTSLTVD